MSILAFLENLQKTRENKNNIKNALINKGVSISDTDTFASYADKINEMSTSGKMENAIDVITYATTYNGSNPKTDSFTFPAGYKYAILDLVILSANANTIGDITITGTDVTVTQKLSTYKGQSVNGQVTVYTNRRTFLLERADYSSDVTINTSIKASEMRAIYGTLIY